MDKKKKKENKEEEYLNNWKKAQADLENFQKEVANKMEDLGKYFSQDIFQEMTEVVDNLESAVQYAEGELKTGLDQVLKKSKGLMEKHGVKKIEVKAGDKFDPHLHEAMEGIGDTIAEQVRPGYMIHDRVLRPALVKVK